MREQLAITSIGVNRSRIVFVGGELDLDTAPQLVDFLADLEDQHVILDLWDLTFVDSTGLRVLVEADTRLAGQSRLLTLRWAQGGPLRAIQILGLDTVLRVDAVHQGDPRRAGERSAR
jgi:anti-anti-sigma factor